MMTPLVHVATGQAYLWGVGGLSLILFVRLWRQAAATANDDQRRLAYSSSLLFAGLVWMALSCGPHHGHWGGHLLNTVNRATPLDTVTILIALPFGAAWLWWQGAAVLSERPNAPRTRLGRRLNPGLVRMADRWPSWWRTDWTIPGDSVIPAAALLTLTAYCAVVVATNPIRDWSTQVTVQVALVALYLIVGAQWWHGQFKRRHTDAAWSAKGCTLGMIWPTCAMSHYAWAVGASSGAYEPDGHMLVIDAIGIPAAAGFIAWLARLRVRTTTPACS